MRKSEISSLFVPQRQSTSAIIIFIYNFLVRMLKGFWPVLLVLFLRSGQKQNSYEYWLNSFIIVGGAASLILSIVSYFRYYYHLEGDRLIIQKGVLNQTRIKLPFERIQNIHLEQKVLHRLLNVVSIRIDSAGSQGSEITIEALEREQAESIRSYVLAQKKDATPSQSTGERKEQTGFQSPSSEVLRLDLGDLIRVGVSQNHLRTAGIIVGTVFGFVFTLADSLGDGIWKTGYEEMQELNPGFGLYAILATGLIIIAFVITVLRTIARYYDLRFLEDREGFQLTAGLFNRRETALKKNKVQIIRWADNPIRRALKIFVLTIRQANAGGQQRSNIVTIPGCRMEQVEDVIYSSFPAISDADYQSHRIDKAYLWWYFRYFGILPLLIFGTLTVVLSEPRFLLPALGFPLVSFWYLRAYYRTYRLLVDLEYVKTESGVIGRTHSVTPIHKVQSVDVQQSFYQRNKDLADLILYTAGGQETIPFLPVEKAEALRDYILYRVESQDDDWM
jgi:putative membrane protein